MSLEVHGVNKDNSQYSANGSVPKQARDGHTSNWSNSESDDELPTIAKSTSTSRYSSRNGSVSRSPVLFAKRPAWQHIVDSDDDSDIFLTRKNKLGTLASSDSEKEDDVLPSIHESEEDQPKPSKTSQSIRKSRKLTQRQRDGLKHRNSCSRNSRSRTTSRSPIPLKTHPTWKDVVDSDEDSDVAPIREKNYAAVISSGSEKEYEDDLPSIHEYQEHQPNPLSTKQSNERVKKLTQKQRDELKKQTLSKTQKMIREKPVSLPYEKPKALNLSEFLAKRAQAKAEFYNPSLKKLRPPTPPQPAPLDLTELDAQQAPTARKVQEWICRPDDPPVENGNSIDTAFEKLDEFLIEDLSLGGDEAEVPGNKPSDPALVPMDPDHGDDIPCVSLELEESVANQDCTPTPSKTVPTLETEVVCAGVVATEDSAAVVKDSFSLPLATTEAAIEKSDEPDEQDSFKSKEAALEQYLAANRPPRKTLAELLNSNPAYADVRNLKPKIRPTGDGIVDFASETKSRISTKLSAIDLLKSRFWKHVVPVQKPKEQHFTVTVTSKEEDSQGNQSSVIKNVDYVQDLRGIEDNESPSPAGARRSPASGRYNKFREKLQERIRAAKAKELEEKLKTYENEKSLEDKPGGKGVGGEDDLLDDDHFTTESEPEVTDEEAEALRDSLRRKKKKVKSAFLEEEAEYSEADTDLESDEVQSGDEGEEEDDAEADELESEPNPKTYRRVVAVVDSSDEEEADVEIVTLDDLPSSPSLPALPTREECEMDTEVVTLDGEPMEASKLSTQSSAQLELLVPKEDPDSEFEKNGQLLSPQGDLHADFHSQEITPAQRNVRKLFESPMLPPPPPSESALPSTSALQLEAFTSESDHCELGTNKIKRPYSKTLCRFDSQQALDSFQYDLAKTPQAKPVSDEIAKLVSNSVQVLSPDLGSICSGVFPSQDPLTPAESQCSAFQSQGVTSLKAANADPDVTVVPVVVEPVTPRVEREQLKKTRLTFVDRFSSDSEAENGEQEVTVGKIKKNTRRLQFSDDEDEDEIVEEAESPKASEEYGIDVERGYDSEENEVAVTPRATLQSKGIVSKKGKIRREFVDNEAELSGSEEGSGDEDERGLDQMDEEEGDLEDIDEDAIRHQIGQQHVKNLIDDDDRQIRFLQDVLLEDGDLHGEGELRERQFKWKHIDKLDFNLGTDEDLRGSAAVEDNADRLWQEEKAEKTRWLKENSQITQLEEIGSEEEDSQKLFLENGKHFKFGKSTRQKIQSSCSFMESSSSVSLCTSETSAQIATDGLPLMRRRSAINSQAEALFASPDDPLLKIKRGSFLARGTEGLTKIAEMTKTNEFNNSIKVNSRNFVFSIITPPGPQESSGTGKRKNNLPRHPTSRQETNPRKMPRMDRSFDSLDAATKASSIFSQF